MMEALHTSKILQHIGRLPKPGRCFAILDANRLECNSLGDDTLPTFSMPINPQTQCILSGKTLTNTLFIDWRGHKDNCSVWELPISLVGRWRLGYRAIAVDILASTPEVSDG